MDKVFVIEVPSMCECGYPTWDTFGIYKTREEAMKDYTVLLRQAELNGDDKPALLEKEFKKSTLENPALGRVKVLVDEEEMVAHVERPYVSVQDVAANEEDFWTDETEFHIDAIMDDGHYRKFEFERTLYLVINEDDTRESLKQRAREFVKKEGYDVI